jgi:hypothetical protein
VDDYRPYLKRVGYCFFALSIVLCIYTVFLGAANLVLSVGLLLALAVALTQGSLAVARWVSRGVPFLFGVFAALLIELPLKEPFDLWTLRLQLAPWSAILIRVVAAAAASVLLVWIYRQLEAPAVVRARVEAGYRTFSTKLVFVVGVLWATLGMLFQLPSKADSTTAQELAEKQFGPAYKYHAQAICLSGDQMLARLAAYNDHEIRTLRLKWKTELLPEAKRQIVPCGMAGID